MSGPIPWNWRALAKSFGLAVDDARELADALPTVHTADEVAKTLHDQRHTIKLLQDQHVQNVGQMLHGEMAGSGAEKFSTDYSKMVWSPENFLDSFKQFGVTPGNAEELAAKFKGPISGDDVKAAVDALGLKGSGTTLNDMMHRSSDLTSRYRSRTPGSDMSAKPGIFKKTASQLATQFEEAGNHEAAANLRSYMDDSEVQTPLAHGTQGDFDHFGRTNDIGYHVGNLDQAHDINSNRGAGGIVKSNIMPVFLKGNYLEVNDLGGWHPDRVIEELEHQHPDMFDQSTLDRLHDAYDNEGTDSFRTALSQELEKRGYDGFKYRNVGEGKVQKGVREGTGNVGAGGDKEFSYIAMRPENLKSATGNSGRFNPNDPNLLAATLFAPIGMMSAKRKQELAAGTKGWSGHGAEGDLRTDAEITRDSALNQQAGEQAEFQSSADALPGAARMLNPVTQAMDSYHAMREGASRFDTKNPMSRANIPATLQTGMGAIGIVGSLGDAAGGINFLREGAAHLLESKAGRALLTHIAENPGGGTFSPFTGSPITSGGAVVANPPGAASIVLDHPPTQADLHNFFQQNAAHFAENPNATGGWWQDPDTGKFFLEAGSVHPREEAVRLGTQRGEKAVWDLDAGESIPTGETAQVGSGTQAALPAGPLAAPAVQTADRWKPTERGVIDRSVEPGYTGAPLPFETKASPRAKPTALAQQLSEDPRVESRLESDLLKGLHLGGETWYAPGPLKAAVEEHGGDFTQFTRAGGAGSIRTPTHNELTNASILMYAQKNGISYKEAVQIFKQKFPGLNPYFMGTHGAVFDRGSHLPTSPTAGTLKVPNYVNARMGGFGLALDTHENRAAAQALGLNDEDIIAATKSAQDYNLRTAPYLRLAEKYGLHPSQVQAGRWIGGGTQTGLFSQPTGDLAQTVEDGLLYTNRVQGLGEDPAALRKTFADIVQGNGFFLPTSNRGGFPVY